MISIVTSLLITLPVAMELPPPATISAGMPAACAAPDLDLATRGVAGVG
jgi:hypothetical protein